MRIFRVEAGDGGLELFVHALIFCGSAARRKVIEAAAAGICAGAV
jgi:hypothetical protein